MRQRTKNGKSILFDEVVSDSVSGESGHVKERPIKDLVFYSVAAGFFLVALVMAGRIAFLGFMKKDLYAARAASNSNVEAPVRAPRGIILDRFGEPLVENKPTFSVYLHIAEMIRNGNEDRVFQAVEDVLGIPRGDLVEMIRHVNIEETDTVLVASDITRDEIMALRSADLPSLQVEDDHSRYYIHPAFSHLIGYVGQSSEDAEVRGRAGLEAAYEDVLHGTDGRKIYHRNAQGELQGMAVIEKPVQGGTLETTIDGEFQKYFYDQFKAGLDRLGRTSGVAIAMDPRNGEVLALMSFPEYDANDIRSALLAPNEPLFNRAVSGVYNPASTIKLMHAAVALKEGVVTPSTNIYSAGYIELPNPYHPENPSRFVDWKAHGWVDVYSAIARSSNIYFYESIGGFENIRGVGIARLREYWQRFGFEKKTGIDLPGEGIGFLPSAEEKEERTGNPWRIGDTYNISIGQGDLRITPLELISAVSAIVHGGQAYVPHIKKTGASEILYDMSDLAPQFAIVREGMEDAVSETYGTAHLLNTIPARVLGKTGSAQVSNKTKTNALFVGAMPAEDPQIVILILIEDAVQGSSNTLPTARDALQWYYDNRIKEVKHPSKEAEEVPESSTSTAPSL